MTRTVNFQFPNGFYGRASIGHKLNEFGRIKLSTHPEKFCSTFGRHKEKYYLEAKIAALRFLHFPGDFRAVTKIAALSQRLIEGHSEK